MARATDCQERSGGDIYVTMNFKHFWILLIAAVFSAGLFFHLRSPLASDESLIENFRQNRDHFEHVVRMTKEDTQLLSVSEGLVSIEGNLNWNDREEGFTVRRRDEYIHQLRQLSPHIRRASIDEGRVYFGPASSASSEIDGFTESIVIWKEYVYSETVPGQLVESLNGTNFDSVSGYYKRIDGNWYLYFDRGLSKPE